MALQRIRKQKRTHKKMGDELFNHWDKVMGIIGAVVSFIVGFKMRKIKLQKASQEALEHRYKTELQKLENYKRAFEINSEMIESVKSDFLARIQSLSAYIKQLEQMNRKLHQIIAEQQEKLEDYNSKYGTDI